MEGESTKPPANGSHQSKAGSRQPTPHSRPVRLSPKTAPLLEEMVGLLRNRATKHAKLSYAFLVAITAAVIMGLVVIALAPTILGNDLEKALQKEAVLDLFNTEQKDLEAEESDLDTRTSALKADFVRQFGTGESWITAELPEDSGPKISLIRPRGNPPTPSAASSEMEPVEITATGTIASFDPSRKIEPFPNCFSI